ncbi:MAG: SHOCT domain-containing protein [Dehalococcoidales bacterium]|jgi:putative membrane protein|nr:SHOCT domain-containing protein [Dehalococcoidales bacterium]|tara:strand:+ start:329 stop:691 length:363 start_codon:yes stop_codon:yes gene_type:complete
MNKNMKIGLIVGGVILAALVIVHLVAMSTGWEACRTGMTEHRMMGPWMMKGLGGWSMMGIIRLVVIGLIVWLVVSLVRSNQATSSSHTWGEAKALEILKTRYARGEIDKAEYEEKLKDLQ